MTEPLDIKPGQHVRFQCPDCNRGFWHVWQPADSNVFFAPPSCTFAECRVPRRELQIVAVEDF